MLKDALYQGLHGPVSLADLLARLQQEPTFELRAFVQSPTTGGVILHLQHRVSQARHTLIYAAGTAPATEPVVLRLVAVDVTGSPIRL